MTESHVQQLLRRAVQTSDPTVMRKAVEILVNGGPGALSPDDEYATRHEDYVMEMPQSGERISGRDAMRSMQESFPNPPTISVRRVVGAETTWVLEGVNDYGDDAWHVVVILELETDGRVLRDTRYYAKALDPPDWRAGWVEPM
jgi:hypothetical protein